MCVFINVGGSGSVMVKSSNDGTNRAGLRKLKGAFGGCWKTGLHLYGCNDRAIKWVYSSGTKRGHDRFRCEGSEVRTTKDTCKITFRDTLLVQMLMSINLCLPLLLHPGKADDIEALQCMRTVGWIAEDDNVVGIGILQQLVGIMRAMPIHEKDSNATIGLVFCLCIKIDLDPATGEVTICPSVR